MRVYHTDCQCSEPSSRAGRRFLVFLAGWLLLLAVRADQVETRNGDRYAGKVLSLDTNILVMQSEVLGKVQVSRSNIALITLGGLSVTNLAQTGLGGSLSVRETRSAPASDALEASRAPGQLTAQTNLMQNVQKMYLGEAGPEANDKYNELMSGFLSGSLTVDDIRAQAKTAVEQARALRNDLGEEAGGSLDKYIAILDKFLKEPTAGSTNTANSAAKPGGGSP